MAVGRNERRAGIETDFWAGGHEWIILEPVVERRVRNDEQVFLQNRVRTQGNIPSGLIDDSRRLSL